VPTTLVTGGAGFIGSHLVRALLARGEAVRVIDNFDALAHPGGAGAVPPGTDLVTGDLRDAATVERALEGVDRVFHLGGVVGNGESLINVRRAVDSNALGTATLLEAVLARREHIRRFVVASSMVVYGEGAYECEVDGAIAPRGRPLEQLRRREWEPRCPCCDRTLRAIGVHEDQPLRPTSVYGSTKRAQEELALVLGAAYGLEVVALRYLNVYGPGQALANPYTGVAAIFAARFLRERRPLIFEDGGQLRDLIHVSDVVRATLAAMDASADACGRAFNVATGRRVTILELAVALGRALDSPLEPEVTGEFRAGDIRHCFADTAAARAVLGFEARRSLEDGLPELAEWVSRQTVDEGGDEAIGALRERGLVG